MAATDDTTPSTVKVRPSGRTLAVLGVIAVVVFGLDQLAKRAVLESLSEGERVPFLGEFLQLHLVFNPGAAFSLLSGTTWVFAIIASLVVVVIIVFARRIRSIAWATVFGLLLGGTTGNLYDRLFREPGFGVGHVVDFLQLWAFPAIFNLADVAICCAAGLFILLSLRGIGFDGSKAAKAEPEPAASDS